MRLLSMQTARLRTRQSIRLLRRSALHLYPRYRPRKEAAQGGAKFLAQTGGRFSVLKKNSFVRSAFSVTGVIIVAKLLGFVKQMISAGLFGATLETDLITLSQGSLIDVQYLLSQVLLTAFTSLYIHIREQESSIAASRFVSNTLRAFSLIALAISSLFTLTAPLLARIIAPSYSMEASARLSTYLRIYAPLLVVFVWIAVFQALLNSQERFVPGEMVSVNQSLIFIAVALLFRSRLRERSMILAFFLYAAYNALYLGFCTRRYWRWSGGRAFTDPAIQKLFRMTGPLLLGYSMIYVNQQVDKILVSGMGDGAVTALTYGATLSNLISTFIISFCGILFTYVTVTISHGETERAAQTALTGSKALIFLFLPISILTACCAEDIVRIVFGRGAFDDAAVAAASHSLRGYCIAFVPLVFREVYSRFQYGYQETRRPMLNSTIGIFCNIALSIALSKPFGIWGITFASSFSVTVCGLLNFLTAKRCNANVRLRELLPALPRLVLGGLAVYASASFSLRQLASFSPLPRFVLTALVSLILYGLLAAPMLRKLLQSCRSILREQS